MIYLILIQFALIVILFYLAWDNIKRRKNCATTQELINNTDAVMNSIEMHQKYMARDLINKDGEFTQWKHKVLFHEQQIKMLAAKVGEIEKSKTVTWEGPAIVKDALWSNQYHEEPQKS